MLVDVASDKEGPVKPTDLGLVCCLELILLCLQQGRQCPLTPNTRQFWKPFATPQPLAEAQLNTVPLLK